jgi:hypothetical protein
MPGKIMVCNRRDALRRMGIGAGALALSPSLLVRNAEAEIVQPATTLENYFNPFKCPKQDLTWDNLQTPEQRKADISSKFSIDTTSEIPPIENVWRCNEYALRTMIHFFGFPESQDPSYNNFMYDTFRTNKESNAMFNRPVYYVGIYNKGPPEIKHAINGVLVGDNPLNFNDWYFIESQNDKEPKIGDWDMPKDSTVWISAINEFDNQDVYRFNILGFKLNNTTPELIYTNPSTNPSLVLSRPGPTLVAEENPTGFTLSQNYPNPFNARTTIEYNLEKPGKVSLEVYNLSGQKLETLVDGNQPVGNHRINFDASRYSSGTYLYKLNAGNSTKTNKMMLVK